MMARNTDIVRIAGRQFATLLSGSVLAQAIPLCLAPVLTRLFSPEQFGALALFLSVALILSVTVTARYEVAIMLPKLEKNAEAVFFVCVLLSLLMSGFISVGILFLYPQLESILGVTCVYLVPLFTLAIGIWESSKALLVRRENYECVALRRVELSATIGGLQVAFGGLTNFGVTGLILGQVIAQLIASAKLFIAVTRSGIESFTSLTLLRTIAAMRRYRSLAIKGTPALFISRAAQESLIFLVAIFISPGVSGLVALLNRVLLAPSAMLAANIGEVFYQKICNIPRSASFPLILKFTLSLILVSLPLHMILFVLLDLYFVDVFGEEWSAALEILPYLVVVTTMSFVFSPVSMLFNYFEIQGYNLIWQATWLGSNVLLFAASERFQLSMDQVFMAYAFKQVVLYVVALVGFTYFSWKIYER